MKIYYLSQIDTTTYSSQAINYISNALVLNDIILNTNALNVSATAVAGIMAKENDSYWKQQFRNELSDAYALTDLHGSTAVDLFNNEGLDQ